MTDCPECGLPTDVVDTYTLPSTAGPVEHVVTVCVARHRITTAAPSPAYD